MQTKTVLISGAGIAGLTLAYWLHHFGFVPTIVEKRPNLDAEGYMIDFYGSGFDVAEKMGLIEQLRAQHYQIPKLTFVDQNGAEKAVLDVEKFRAVLKFRHFNFMRGDLETVLYDAIKDNVDIRFVHSISELHPNPEGVDVRMADGSTGSYDLVVGADGIHSNVRQLLWGDEARFARFLGFYVACSIIENFLGRSNAFYSHLHPGSQASVYSIRGNRLATLFAFKGEPMSIHGHDQKMAALARGLAGSQWVVPKLLELTSADEGLFFDAVSQIHVPNWFQGRVALVGDACQCLTLLAGQGASMGMAGAYLLANELHAADGEHTTAFAAYQAKLQPEIMQRQKQAQKLANSFVPNTRFAIWVTHLFMRAAFLPGFRAIVQRQIGSKSIIK
ncbi:MAG: FAD-dependent monooxygenase [Caldilineaceae bacterium]